MRVVVLAFVAALFGAVVGSTFAEAGEPAASAACSDIIPIGGVDKFLGASQAAVAAHLAAGRTHFVVVPVNASSTICAW
jgi:hypothetical protein